MGAAYRISAGNGKYFQTAGWKTTREIIW